ncbi:transposase [Gloeothece verrucosa]
MKNWLAETVGYFDCKTTNSIFESINNQLKVFKRYGF